MLKLICPRLLSLRQSRISSVCRRKYLSPAYMCTEEWNLRHSTPLLKDLDASNFALQIQDNIEKTDAVTAIDMDLLANKMDAIDPIQLDFVQNLFQKFHFGKEALLVSDSMSYGIVRALFGFKEYDRLLTMLKDKESYGVFLEDFSSNILLSHFVKNGMHQEAAEIAFDQMLQEDLNNPITRWLSLLACHKLWKNPSPPKEVAEEQEDEEEEIVVVNYIRLPFYDDHWDISRDTLKIGKTLWTITSMENETVLMRSYKLIGLALWEKYDKVLELMSQWIKESDQEVVCQEAIDEVQHLLENLETKEVPETPKDPGLLTVEDDAPFITSNQKEEYLLKLNELKMELANQKKVRKDFNLAEALETQVSQVVSSNESEDIEKHKIQLNAWCEQRQQRYDERIERLRVEKTKVEIAEKLLALKDKEERLRFFEQYEKIKLGVSRAPEELEFESSELQEHFVAPPSATGKR